MQAKWKALRLHLLPFFFSIAKEAANVLEQVDSLLLVITLLVLKHGGHNDAVAPYHFLIDEQ